MHLRLPLSKSKKSPPQVNPSTSGYTLVEVLVVALMVSVLAVIGGAGFVGWLTRLKVNAAQLAALDAIRNAQLAANRRNARYQASFREENDRVYWAMHSPDAAPTWIPFEQTGVKIDTTNTTLYKDNSNNLWRVQFNYKGHTNGQLGRITLSNSKGGNKRCVFVSTLLGVVRTDRDDRCKK